MRLLLRHSLKVGGTAFQSLPFLSLWSLMVFCRCQARSPDLFFASLSWAVIFIFIFIFIFIYLLNLLALESSCSCLDFRPRFFNVEVITPNRGRPVPSYSR
jgi:hypothetical protein